MLSMAFGPMAGLPAAHAAGARPGVLGQVGILHAELNAALRTLVELVPEAECRFLNRAEYRLRNSSRSTD